MGHWLVVVPQAQHEAERMYHRDSLEVAAGAGASLGEGDQVAVAAGDPLMVFGLGRVVGVPQGDGADGSGAVIRYTHRALDAPVPLNDAPAEAAPGRPAPLDERAFEKLVAQVGPEHAVTAARRSWLVSVGLPIEATSPAEAARQFWTYVTQLGPGELPAFVSPADDELVMQAYVLGEPANLDPEEEDD